MLKKASLWFTSLIVAGLLFAAIGTPTIRADAALVMTSSHETAISSPGIPAASATVQVGIAENQRTANVRHFAARSASDNFASSRNFDNRFLTPTRSPFGQSTVYVATKVPFIFDAQNNHRMTAKRTAVVGASNNNTIRLHVNPG